MSYTAYKDESGQHYSEQDMVDQFEGMLDEVYGTVSVAGMEYGTARALKDLDPIAYRCWLLDYIDGAEVEEVSFETFDLFLSALDG